MLGTITLIALVVLGYIHFSLWVLIPAAIINAFIGLHFPSGKADTLKERGMYWSVFFQSLPLQAVLAGVFYGVGYGIRYTVDRIM